MNPEHRFDRQLRELLRAADPASATCNGTGGEGSRSLGAQSGPNDTMVSSMSAIERTSMRARLVSEAAAAAPITLDTRWGRQRPSWRLALVVAAMLVVAITILPKSTGPTTHQPAGHSVVEEQRVAAAGVAGTAPERPESRIIHFTTASGTRIVWNLVADLELPGGL